MPYSYNDFLNAATSSGLLGEFLSLIHICGRHEGGAGEGTAGDHPAGL